MKLLELETVGTKRVYGKFKEPNERERRYEIVFTHSEDGYYFVKVKETNRYHFFKISQQDYIRINTKFLLLGLTERVDPLPLEKDS